LLKKLRQELPSNLRFPMLAGGCVQALHRA
jgi:hypothetical protein